MYVRVYACMYVCLYASAYIFTLYFLCMYTFFFTFVVFKCIYIFASFFVHEWKATVITAKTTDRIATGQLTVAYCSLLQLYRQQKTIKS